MPTSTLDANDLMMRLRTETRSHHDRAEEGGFGTLVMEGGLQMAHYLPHLVAWRRIHAQMEHHLRTSTDPTVQAVWSESLAKAPILEADIDALSPGGIQLDDTTAAAVLAGLAMIDTVAVEHPASLLGVLYVLEGSTLGGTMMKPRIAEQLGLTSGAGLTYYGVYGKEVRAKFGEFRQAMSDAANDTEHEDRIIEAAKMTFDRLGAILTAIVQAA
jgi:heme oxygenase